MAKKLLSTLLSVYLCPDISIAFVLLNKAITYSNDESKGIFIIYVNSTSRLYWQSKILTIIAV